MADDQGWGDVAYDGHPVLKTPHIDAMAENNDLPFLGDPRALARG